MPSGSGSVQTWPRLLLRVEGAALFASTVYAYSRLPARSSWYTFAALLLLPDLGMVGYLVPSSSSSSSSTSSSSTTGSTGGTKGTSGTGTATTTTTTTVGAAIYNALHTETPPIMLLCVALARGGRDGTVATGWALVWLAHIGMDRMFGFGLKYGTGFGDTHLGRIG